MDIASCEFNAFAAFGHDKVIRKAFVVVQKILLDQVTSISEAKDELLMSKMSKVLHHMPEYWAVPDRHHRLWDVLSVVAQSQTQAPTEQHHLHMNLLLCYLRSSRSVRINPFKP